MESPRPEPPVFQARDWSPLVNRSNTSAASDVPAELESHRNFRIRFGDTETFEVGLIAWSGHRGLEPLDEATGAAIKRFTEVHATSAELEAAVENVGRPAAEAAGLT